MGRGALTLVTVLLLLGTLTLPADILRVNRAVVAGAGDGSSWDDAYRHLQDALDDASSGDEIWVARGVYYPDEGTGLPDNDPGIAFEPPRGVGLYGGFAGTETDHDQRDPAVHLTILSGDLEQDDLDTNSNDIAESSDHIQGTNSQTVVLIVSADRNTILDGFVITAGNNPREGGGLVSSAPELRIAHCRFQGNRAGQYGGAVQLFRAQVHLANCTFLGNHAGIGGGAINFSGGSNISTVSNCLFLANTGGQTGGGFRLDASSPHFFNCTLAGNVAGSAGGGFYTRSSSTPQFEGCILWGNEATDTSNPDDHSFRMAGGAAQFRFSVVQGWEGNLTRNGGNIHLDPLFLAPVQPGVLVDPVLLNLSATSPAIDLGPSRSTGQDHTDLDRDGNPVEALPIDLAGTPRVIGGKLDAGVFESGAGPGLLQVPDPIVLRPGGSQLEDVLDLSTLFEAAAEQFALLLPPPADFATVMVDPATGLIDVTVVPGRIGHTKFVVSASDSMGGTTYLPLTLNLYPPVFHVDADAPAGGDGMSWQSAFRTLQDALQFGGAGYEIWVAEGVYYPDEGAGQTDDDSTSVFLLSAGVPVFGGFTGGEAERSERDPDLHPTILSGDLAQDDMNTDGNGIAESPDDLLGTNAETIVRAGGPGGPMTLSGFIVTGAKGPTSSESGALAVVGATLAVSHCRFHGNAGSGGAALSVRDAGNVTLTGSAFSGNRAIGFGGAARNSSTGTLSFEDCLFTRNRAARGGALATSGRGALILRGCLFTDNEGTFKSGALDAEDTGLTIDGTVFRENLGERAGALDLVRCDGLVRDCLFERNSVEPDTFNDAGAIQIFGTAPDFVRCTFTDNWAHDGGAISCRNASFTIANCVFAAHQVGGQGGAIDSSDCAITIVNSIFAGNSAGNGGAIYNWIQAGPIVNCAFTGNSARIHGGAIFNGVNGWPEPPPPISNSIFWKNVEAGATDSPGASIYNHDDDFEYDGRASFSHCLLPGSSRSTDWPADFGIDLGNNLDADPLFIAPLDPNEDPPLTFDLRLQVGSPAINAGHNSAFPADGADLDGDGDLDEPLPLDFDGRMRVRDTNVDLGPHEAEPGPGVGRRPNDILLRPLSGSHPSLFDASTYFISPAQDFQLAGQTPAGLLTATIDPVTGLLSVEVAPDVYGRTHLAIAAKNEEGDRSLLSLAIDIAPMGLRVDPRARGKGTGLTWEDAFPSLQEALAARPLVHRPLTLWLARGIYRPDEGPGVANDDPEARFVLPPSCHLFGGFAGNETREFQRDPDRHLTILSGDLAGDDPDPDRDGILASARDQVGTNSRHILFGSAGDSDSLIDGVVITAAQGSAVLLEDSELVFSNCRFQGNLADFPNLDHVGGAARILRGAPHFLGCTFVANAAGAGGAVYSVEGDPVFNGCRFERNAADEGSEDGGAIYLFDAHSAHLTSCTFSRNHAESDGGAIQARSSTLVIGGALFEHNTARAGGALDLDDCHTTLTGSVFTANAAGNGGAIHGLVDSAFPFSCIYTRFLGNRAGAAGGAINFPLLPEATPGATFENCLFSGNAAVSSRGGAISAGANLALAGCTFTGNAAGDKGGALSIGDNSTLTNSIIWNNSSAGLTNTPAASIRDSSRPITFSHCIVANSGGSTNWDATLGIDGGNNLDADPLFAGPVDPATAPTLDGLALLTIGSPAIDAGLTPVAPRISDLRGGLRVMGPAIDLGPYEWQGDQLDSDDDGLGDIFELIHTSPMSSTALDPLSDHDHDGLPAIVEAALGLDPNEPDLPEAPALWLIEIEGEQFLTLTFRRDLAAGELVTITPERSSDLGASVPWSSMGTAILSVSRLDAATDLVTVRSLTPVTSQQAEQLRLRVTKR